MSFGSIPIEGTSFNKAKIYFSNPNYLTMIDYRLYQKALKIVLAYHQQIAQEAESIKPISKQLYKDKELLQVGDFVQCVEVHGNSKNNLTKGNKYEVIRTNPQNRGGLYFSIRNDHGKLCHFNSNNNQFKALI